MNTSSSSELCIIVPCFNEAKRISKNRILALVTILGANVFLVDDGSTDETWNILREIERESEYVRAIRLSTNVGKAKAIFRGLEIASEFNFDFFATYDADSPIDIVDYLKAIRFIKSRSDLILVSGARIVMAGGKVQRTTLRRWIGRVIATMISLLIKTDFYDPQSPLKVFRRDFFINAYEPKTKWFHDVEFILLIPIEVREKAFFEFPLENWCEVEDGSISITRFIPICLDILRIGVLGFFQNKKEAKSK